MSHGNDSNHTANFLVSSFLISKRSLKKVYDFNLGNIAILRYLADSIDLNFKKRKCLKTKLHQSQIAKYCHCDPKTVRVHVEVLVRKKLIKYNPKLSTFTLGNVLKAWGKITATKDIGKISPLDRCRENLPTSYSSNISNKTAYQNNEKQTADVATQSTSFREDSDFIRSDPQTAKSILAKIRLENGL